MAKHQTAVQWLIEELGEYFPHEIGGIHLMVEKAKQIEKEQHGLTFARGSMTGYSNANGYESVDFEQYYNKTYGT
jgi:hypothetical protein